MEKTVRTYQRLDAIETEKFVEQAESVVRNSYKNFLSDALDLDVQFQYNANGAMTQDLNKGITSIAYNYLNLPQEIVINQTGAQGKAYYTYSATGQKLRVVREHASVLREIPVTGLSAMDVNQTDSVDYVGNFIYENDSLKRILVEGGYIEDGNYYFYITDHLGNNRIVADASGDVVQSNEYYPFGLLMATSTGADKQPYKYGSKELDSYNGLNLYDFEARFLDSGVPGFTTQDPLAEKYYSISPYVYVANNPIKFIDPTGMSMDDYYVDKQGEILAQVKTNEEDRIIVNELDEVTVRPQGPIDYYSRGDTPKALQDINSNTTVNRESYENFEGYNNIGPDYWASLAGTGLTATGGTFTMFLQHSLDKNKYLQQSYYSAAYSAREMSTKFSLSKIRVNLGSLGRNLGSAAYGYTFFDSAIGYGTGRTSGTDATFNIGLGAASLRVPGIGISYGAVELLHPGGWKGWRENMNELYKYGDERVMFGPKF